MARQTLNYTVTAEGRDKGKVFVLTEMSASKAESWAMRALLALMGSGVEVPEGFERMGMAGMAEVGFRALTGLHWDVAKPLLDEMMECVAYMPDAAKPQIVRPLMESAGVEDIEEVATRLQLRVEVWKLHTGFLKAVAPSIFERAAAAKGQRSRNTKTSRQ